MAEFKLGRIRFVWQGDWAAGRAYVADDVVSNGGKSYICIRNHTSLPEFNTDFTSELQNGILFPTAQAGGASGNLKSNIIRVT